jgi:hypothetical protein
MMLPTSSMFSDEAFGGSGIDASCASAAATIGSMPSKIGTVLMTKVVVFAGD